MSKHFVCIFFLLLSATAICRNSGAPPVSLCGAETSALQRAANVAVVYPPVPASGIPDPSQGALVPPASPLLRYIGSPMGWRGSAYPDNHIYNSTGLTCVYGMQPYSVEFIFSGSSLKLLLKGINSASYRIRVDGALGNRYYTPVGMPTDGHLYITRIDFAGRAVRRLRLDFNGYTYFGGIYVGQEADVAAPDWDQPPRVVVLGDSFTEGAQAAGRVSYARSMADFWGLDLYQSGCGGTGYLNPGPYGRVPFSSRVQHDVIDQNPAMVIVAGGMNDLAYGSNQVHDAAASLFNQIRADLPNTVIVALSPWSPRTPSTTTLALRDAISNAAAETGVQFIDTLQPPWINGIAGDCSTGNACAVVGSDGAHPNQSGYDYLGARLAHALASQFSPCEPRGMKPAQPRLPLSAY